MSWQANLSGKRVLVTGGTGFVGGRLVERLVQECHAEVRVLVHNFAKAIRVARYPVEMAYGDLTRPDEVSRAVEGCEIVFHCAYGNRGQEESRRAVNVQGTGNVLEAALRQKVKRIVHLSTVVVYGWDSPEGELNEGSPKRYTEEFYASSKRQAEELVNDYVHKHGAPAVILQPTAVYGPSATPWTVDVLQWLKTERVILVNGGSGLCNAVYIDDLITAILSAAVQEHVIGESFLISGEKPVTWKEFFCRFEHMLGFASTVEMSMAEAEAYYASKQPKIGSLLPEAVRILREEPLVYSRLRHTREIATLVKIARTLLPVQMQGPLKKRPARNGRTGKVAQADREVVGKPVQLLRPYMIHYYASKARVSIDKAKRLLNYRPQFDFETGMERTAQWVQWANLL
jgi:nucleoside-diphosphate-sugar epimerase